MIGAMGDLSSSPKRARMEPEPEPGRAARIEQLALSVIRSDYWHVEGNLADLDRFVTELNGLLGNLGPMLLNVDLDRIPPAVAGWNAWSDAQTQFPAVRDQIAALLGEQTNISDVKLAFEALSFPVLKRIFVAGPLAHPDRLDHFGINILAWDGYFTQIWSELQPLWATARSHMGLCCASRGHLTEARKEADDTVGPLIVERSIQYGDIGAAVAAYEAMEQWNSDVIDLLASALGQSQEWQLAIEVLPDYPPSEQSDDLREWPELYEHEGIAMKVDEMNWEALFATTLDSPKAQSALDSLLVGRAKEAYTQYLADPPKPSVESKEPPTPIAEATASRNLSAVISLLQASCAAQDVLAEAARQFSQNLSEGDDLVALVDKVEGEVLYQVLIEASKIDRWRILAVELATMHLPLDPEHKFWENFSAYADE